MTYKKLSFLFVLSVFSSAIFAGVILDTTQLFFKSDEKEISFNVTNNSSAPTLVQSWITKDDKPNKDFLITPPLFRLEGNAKSALRISKIINTLPNNKESMYYVNVKGVQPKDPNAENILEFIISSRIALRYRPAYLTAEEAKVAYKKLTFSVKGNKLIVDNATPFYVPLSVLKVDGIGVEGSPYLLEPLAKTEYKISSSTKTHTIVWNSNSLTEQQSIDLN